MKHVIVLLCSLLLIVFTSCKNEADDQQANETMTGNPVIPGYYADPSIIVHEGKYYVFATIDPWGGEELALWESDDFVNWTFHHLNWPTREQCTTEKSTSAMVWAPGVIKALNGRFYMYVSVGSEIWVGESGHPTGPWENPLGDRPLVENQREIDAHTIDAECFIDDDGQAYLYWGSGWDWKDGHCMVARLNPDMISFSSDPIDITPANYFEAPFMLKHNSTYYLMYSEGKCINYTYKVQYSTSNSPFSPWVFGMNSPVLSTNEDSTVAGPGHHTVLEENGRHYILYHRIFDPDLPDLYRQICIDSLNFGVHDEMLKVQPTHTGVVNFASQGPREVNLALDAEVVATSSESEKYPAEAAVDEHYGTLWAADPKDEGPAITVDLGEVTGISTCKSIFEYAHLPYRYKIEYSVDNKDWQMYADRMDNEESGSPVIDESKVSARYLRVNFAVDENLPRPAMWELKVY